MNRCHLSRIKIYRFVYFLFFSFLMACMESYSQTSNQTIISGRLLGWNESLSKIPEIEVRNTFANDWGNNVKMYKFSMKQDSFFVTIENVDTVFYIRFKNFFNADESSLANASFCIESGKNIELFRNSENLLLSNNSFLQSQIDLISKVNIIQNSFMHNRQNGDRHAYYFAEMKRQREKVDTILESYSSVLTPFQYRLVRQNYVSTIDAMSWRAIRLMNNDNALDSSKYNEIMKDMILVYQDLLFLSNDNMVLTSNKYLESELNYAWALGALKSIIDKNPSNWFNYVYQFIEDNYNGSLRDMMFALAFRKFSDLLPNHEMAEYVKRVLRISENEELKFKLDNILKSITSGEEVQFFRFYNKDGESVTLDDFKGKVLMVHFWSLGCVPCIEMTKNIHPLIDKYGDNPNVVFLSINVNSSLKHWNSGLSSNLYSHEKELQLNVGELGVRHPLMQYYNYNGVPQLMIIDKDGNLITSNAPKGWNESEMTQLYDMVSMLL